MTDFKALGYQTGEITLPGLDLIVQLNPKQYFRDDGIVDDLTAHTKEVHQQFGLSYQEDVSQSYGISIPFPICLPEEEKSCTMFIRDIDPITNLLVLGHEATHVLINFGMGYYLLQALRAERFLFDPFKRYNNEERIADIGGLLALYKADKIHSAKNLSHSNHLGGLVDDLLNSRQ